MVFVGWRGSGGPGDVSVVAVVAGFGRGGMLGLLDQAVPEPGNFHCTHGVFVLIVFDFVVNMLE